MNFAHRYFLFPTGYLKAKVSSSGYILSQNLNFLMTLLGRSCLPLLAFPICILYYRKVMIISHSSKTPPIVN